MAENLKFRFPWALVCGVIGIALFSVIARAADLERADYSMSLPKGATIDKPEDDIDADHMTTINLPNDSVMIVLVLDDKSLAPAAIAKMTDEYKGKLKDPVVAKTDVFVQPKANQSAMVRGRMNGIMISFALGRIDAKEKSLIVVFTYSERQKTETIGTVQKSLATLKIKE